MDKNELVCLMAAILMASKRYDDNESPLRASVKVAEGIYSWVYYPQPIKRNATRSRE
jgi:hypothetical protein